MLFFVRALAVVLLAVFSMTMGFAAEGEFDADADPKAAFEAKVFDGLPYRLLEPDPSSDEAGETAPDTRYPLVLFLHGAGERGDDNAKQLVHVAGEFLKPDRRREYPAYVVFPQCPSEQRWVDSDWNVKSGVGTFPEEPSESMAKVLGLVDSMVAELPIDPSRIYVCGLSMGGIGTWYAGAARPRRFAAMIQVCGGGDPSWSSRYDGIPIWVLHGQDDPVVSIQRAREMVVGLVESGHSPEIRLTEYPGVGHDSWTQTFARDDVFAWLFSQRKDGQSK